MVPIRAASPGLVCGRPTDVVMIDVSGAADREQGRESASPHVPEQPGEHSGVVGRIPVPPTVS
jgi:hypothetical protein